MKRVFLWALTLILAFGSVFSYADTGQKWGGAADRIAVAGVGGTAAAAAGKWDGTVDVSWYDPTASDYYISTPAQLAGLAALVNGTTDPGCPKILGDNSYIKHTAYENVMLVGAGGGNVSGTVYVSNIDFAYKTVHLTADLDMGGVYNPGSGAWSGPNWTPIGGKFPMLPNEVRGDCQVLDTRFNGAFDGGGHTVSNIYCDRFAVKGFPYSMAIGLIGFLGGNSDLNKDITGTFQNGWQPAVRNVIVGKGYIYGRRMIGGVVGRVGETNNGVIIENCANMAAIKNTDSKGIGGVVGTGWGKGVIRNCYNAGSVTTTYACPAGGICGSNQGLDIYNCYNAGVIDSNGQSRGRGIGGHDSGSYTVGNCYYLAGSDDDEKSGGYYRGTNMRLAISVTKLSAEEMKAQSFLGKLNVNGTAFVADASNTNGGFPILWYQKGGAASGAVSGAASGTASGTVTLSQPAEGGVITADAQTAAFGQTVGFGAEAAPGFKLDYFTVNGEKISTDFYTVTGDITVGAVFSKVRSVTIRIPQSDAFYLVVQQTGFKLDGGKTEAVSNQALSDGDAVLQGNVLKVLVHGYKDMAPPNADEEYTDAFAFELTNAVKNDDGTYTVSGEGNIDVKVQRKTQPKSWLGATDISWFHSQPSAEVYTLTTAAQLAGLAYLVNEEGETFEGVTIKLGNNISLADSAGKARTWTAIGSGADNAFQGVFDGQGHIISDMRAWDDGSYAGLFGCCVKAAIKNVTVMGAVTGEADASYAAGIVSFASESLIENCVNASDISAKGTHAGGISANITDGTVISGCFNYGTVSGTSGVGGVVGVSNTGADSISGCANFGAVTALGSGTYGTGGIAGRLAGKMESCVNYGAVKSSDRFTGGLAGYATTRYTSIISLSKNTGSVYSDSDHQNAAVGGLVGYAQFLTYGGYANTGAVSAGSKFTSPQKGTLIGSEGSVTVNESEKGTIPDYKSIRPEKPTQSGASAPADAADSAATNGNAGGKSTELQNLVRGGDQITQSGTYNIAWFATGTITIGNGLQVTLNGSNGGSEGFSDLSVSVGDGTVLTLADTVLTGNTTLLTVGKNDTLILSGKSALSGNSDAKGNLNPTVSVGGNLTIRGGGSLSVSAILNNASFNVMGGSSVILEQGTLVVIKEGLMGSDGGAFNAIGAGLTIKGGTFLGRTTSDNVPVIFADRFDVSGGTVKVQALKSPAAVSAKSASFTGGRMMASGHSGNSAAGSKAYYNEKAIPGLKAAGGAFDQPLPFGDLYMDDDYYGAVAYCLGKNYLNGTSGTAFSPDGSMTRAMFVTALYRIAGSPAVKGSSSFTDLKQSWYQNAVIWAVDNGISGGTSATTFSPNTPLSREEAAVFLYRFASLSGKNTASAGTDARVPGAVSPWARTEVGWALNNGIFSPESGVMVTPQEFASRALLASALMRYDSISSH